ncbi:MAG: hypothetical protein C0615_00510 [Desulfuromonas sp.]|nr:MAG: hypothetical protein C0615_00510 [Desulfuromonas sp.]
MNKLRLSVECPACKESHRVTAEKVQNGKSIRCFCGTEVGLVGNVRKAQKEYEFFQKALRDIESHHGASFRYR